MTQPSPSLFATTLLKQLGAPESEANVNFVTAWVEREGILAQPYDQNNGLGATLAEPGSVGTNSAGVQSYPSLAESVQATVSELNQTNFAPIKAALVSGNPEQFASSSVTRSAFSTWSGGGYTWPTSGGSSGGGVAGDVTKGLATGLDALTGGISGELGAGSGYLPSTSSIANDLTGGLFGDLNPTKWVGEIATWVESEAATGLAYVVLTLLGIALVGFGALELFGYSPGRVAKGAAGALTPTRASEDIPF